MEVQDHQLIDQKSVTLGGQVDTVGAGESYLGAALLRGAGCVHRGMQAQCGQIFQFLKSILQSDSHKKWPDF